MKNTMIELISDDELIDLLVDTAHEASVPSESNFLAAVRHELKARLTKRAPDAGAACAISNIINPFALSARTASPSPPQRR